ncbi:AAA family ATPase [Nocardia sp. NPDC051030]|uniref:ATP-binding protein n=1 Tax=Nocardia sp. NPDC051030 TaxID=3155162 RepID=UPI00342BCBA9
MLRIRVFGPLEAELDGNPLELPHRRLRVCALLAWLATHPGPHPRSRLAAEFWPEVPEANARANLRSAVWALRTTLGPANGCLETYRDTVELGGDLWVDLAEFNSLAAAGDVTAAANLCRGELLAGLDEEWALRAREDHARRHSQVLAILIEQAETTGDLNTALDCARRRAALNSLDENAWRTLIELLATTGDTAAAVSAYDRLNQTLQTELGLSPAPETTALIHGLRPADSPKGTLRPWTEPGSAAAAEPDSSSHRSPSPEPFRGKGTPGRQFVGRALELRRLCECLERVGSGNGAVVMISGEGGIGKTALAEELLDIAGRQAARTASGAAGGPGDTPLGLWSEVLADLTGGAGALPGDAPWVADLARLVPGVAPRVRSAAHPEHDRIRLFEAVVQLLGVLAARGPLVLALEDLHLADPTSLDLIGYAGRRITRLPILFVLTRRRLPPSSRADAVLAALRARGTLAAELELGPLDAAAVRTLSRLTAELTAPQVEKIVAAAGGSPLITVAAARQLALGRDEPVEDLRAATRAELGRLTGPARLFVELAAVAGRDLGRADVVHLPLLADPGRAATEALGSGLLRVREGMIGFRHELLRTAVYADIADPMRARLHEALAEELRTRGPGTRPAAEIANHLLLAGHHELAVGQLIQAAADARAVAAPAEAAGFLRAALRVAPDRPDVLIELGEVEAWRGRAEASDAAFDRALELISPRDTGALITAWLRRGMWLRGGICHPRESRRSYRAALDLLDREPGVDPATEAEILAGLAWAESVAGDPGVVDELLRRVSVLTHARPMNDLLTHDVGVARAHALLRAGRFTESYGPLIAAAAAAERAGRPDLAYGCLINAASAAACAGDVDRALDFADRCLALVVPNGLLRLVVYVQSGRGAILRRLGRLTEARAAVTAAASAADRLGSADLDGLVWHDRGLLALASGNLPEAAENLRLALELGAPVNRARTRLHRAEILARDGDLPRAEAELRAVTLEPLSPSDFPDTLVAGTQFIQGLIANARGDRALALTRLREAAGTWRGRVEAGSRTGDQYAATIVDLGRPPLSADIDPERELEIVLTELECLEFSRDRSLSERNWLSYR